MSTGNQQNAVPPFLCDECHNGNKNAQVLLVLLKNKQMVISDQESFSEQHPNQKPMAEKMRYALEAQVRYIIRRLRVVPASENA